MATKRFVAIREAVAIAKDNFEALDASGMFKELDGDLFLAKHRLIKAINLIVSLSKPIPRPRRGWI